MGATKAPTIRVDPELARISIGLDLASQFRLWAVARHLNRLENGSSKVSKTELKAALRQFEITYTRQHLRKLIKSGIALFWNEDRHHLYLRSWQHVATELTIKATIENPDLLSNRAGVTNVLLSPGGSLEQWEATIYAGWLYHRNHPTIARETLEKLFGRSADTLRHWEETQLKKTVSVRANYAQCASAQTWEKARPETTLSYIAKTPNGEQARFLWQISNTYTVKGIKEHRHKGMSKRVRKAVNYQLRQPVNLWRDGSPSRKLYYDSAKILKTHLKTSDEVCYLWRGENRHNHGIFEATETGIWETNAWERVSFSRERQLWSEGNVRLQI